jgi:hypothetical protein
MEVPNFREKSDKGWFQWEAKSPNDALLIPHGDYDNFKFYGPTDVAATYLFTWIQYRGI